MSIRVLDQSRCHLDDWETGMALPTKKDSWILEDYFFWLEQTKFWLCQQDAWFQERSIRSQEPKIWLCQPKKVVFQNSTIFFSWESHAGFSGHYNMSYFSLRGAGGRLAYKRKIPGVCAALATTRMAFPCLWFCLCIYENYCAWGWMYLLKLSFCSKPLRQAYS